MKLSFTMEELLNMSAWQKKVFARKLEQDTTRIENVLTSLGVKLEENISECTDSLKTGESTMDAYKQYFLELE